MISKIIYPWFEAHKTYLWILCFIVLFLLSFDVWNWDRIYPLIFGIPFWIMYHIFLTILVSLIFYVFVKQMWSEE